MASPLTKTALRSLETGRIVVAAGRTHREPIAAKLAERYAAVLGAEETMPDWSFIMELNARLLDRAGQAVLEADQLYRDQLVAIGLERGQRDESKEEIKKRIRDERQSFGGAHGDKGLRILGLDRPPERKPLALYRQAKAILESLRQPGLDLETRSSAIVVDPLAVANEMEPMVEALGQSLEKIDRMLKESVEALVGRRNALKGQREAYVDIALFQEALYRLVEEDEIADRIRPSLRRATRRKPQQDEDKSAPDASPDGEPKDGEPKDGEPKGGEPKDGEPKDGEPKDGETPRDDAASSSGEPSPSSPAAP